MIMAGCEPARAFAGAGTATVNAVRGDLLDLVLVALAAAFAVAGYRQGFIVGALSFLGFIGGAVIGVHYAPSIARALVTNQGWRAVLPIIAVFGAAVIGMLLAAGLGAVLRSRLRGRPTTLLDSVGGAAINVVAVLLLAWLVGALVPVAAISQQVNNSFLLAGVGRLVPKSAERELAAVRGLLNTPPYAQVFGVLDPQLTATVPSPNPSVLRSAGLVRDRGSVVKIEGVAPQCSRTIEGSGFVIGNDRVITNAHVVAGVRRGPEVYTTSQGQYPARVVLFDPRRDIAVLDVPGLGLPALRLAGPAPFAASAIVAGYPLDAGFTAVSARVARAELASGPDIYGNSTVLREIYPIRAWVRPGNSGGPLLAPGGRVYGMVFAAAVSDPGTGYALTAGELVRDVRAGLQHLAAVPTGSCA
jgi:S1-C subfamily serine protease